MKISKLFHWLYAFIMLMPVFFIGGRVLYTVFNKNAKDSYSETTKEYVNTNYDIDINNTYYLDTKQLSSNVSSIDFDISNLDSSNYFNSNMVNVNRITIVFNQPTLYRFRQNTTDLITLNSLNDYTFSFKITNFSNTSIIQDLKLYTFENNSLDNAFSYSVNQLNENPLFAWAKDSFLVTPFAYITGLFGLEATSPINTLLSYWLSISIIWLVFDLVMYLPLLFHRWLDKGVLE